MIFKRVRSAFLFCAAGAVSAAFADRPLDMARNALRDGLWDVVRMEAAKSADPDAPIAVLESYAKERRWDDILEKTAGGAAAQGDGAVYYRALAQAMKGDGAAALETLKPLSGNGSGPYAKRAPLLEAVIALDAGDLPKAARIVADCGIDLKKADVDARLVAAAVFSRSGMAREAKEIWRGVLETEDSGEEAAAIAAAGLGDAESYRIAYGRAGTPALKRSLALALGRILTEKDESFEEGADLVRSAVYDSPDTEGAMETFLCLCDAYLEKEDWEKAASSYKEAMEAWPSAAKLHSVHEGLAWALRKAGRYDEAIESFGKAGECATNDVLRASALMEQGDVLAETSRGAEALAKYKLVLEKYPDTPAGAKLKNVVEVKEMERDGRELFENFKFREAASAFDEVGKRDPSRRESMDYMIMLCLYGQGQDAEASRRAKNIAAVAKNPAIRAEATLWLAKFFYNARQWRDACDLFEEYAVKLAPDSPHAPSSLVWAARAAFAGNEFQRAIDLVTTLSKAGPDSPEKPAGMLVQGEALVELSRLDEAAVVFESVMSDSRASAGDRRRAKMLRADSFFVLGADNPVRYVEALDAYRELQMGEELDADMKLLLAFKTARTLDKLGNADEALDHYYCDVVLAYRDGRARGVAYSEESKATFARAAFISADMLEARGDLAQADRILRLVVKSDVLPAVKEAKNRRERLKKKGMDE